MGKLTPSKILEQVNNNVIGEKEALKSLESILNNSDEEELRFNAIECINNLPKGLKKINSIIETCLISDESEMVRFAAAKYLINTYSEQGFDPLLWAIDNEESIFFFKKMLDLLELSDNQDLLLIEKRILEKISRIYTLNIEDSKFVLDIDYLDYLKFKDEFDEFLEKFDISDEQKTTIIKENKNVGFKGLARVKSSRDGFITHLSLKDLQEIPQSICNLSKLEVLEISFCKIKKMPSSCPNLYRLRQLVLKNNEIDVVPDWMVEFVKNSLNYQKYVTAGVSVSEVHILGLIELLTSLQCNRVAEFHQDLGKNPYYKLNENGQIIGLFYSNKDSWMGLFPLEICKLVHLKELTLINQKIKSIPDSISNLKNLNLLNLKNNKIKKLPRSIIELKRTQLIDFRGNSIAELPKFAQDTLNIIL